MPGASIEAPAGWATAAAGTYKPPAVSKRIARIFFIDGS